MNGFKPIGSMAAAMNSVVRIALLVLIGCIFVSLRTNAQAIIQGMLLKADGKPMPYAELEIVPPELKKIIVDSRFVATSDSRGKFIFNNVPPGRYTLSINFDDKPSQLVPYDTYFYPIAFDRYDAEILKVESSTRLRNLVFRLPPALTAKTITGRVVTEDGSPVKLALVRMWDLRFESPAGGAAATTDIDGRFKLFGFVGRRYQIGAIAFDRRESTAFVSFSNVIGVAETPPFAVQDSQHEMTIVVRPRRNGDEDYWKRYIGYLIMPPPSNLVDYRALPLSSR